MATTYVGTLNSGPSAVAPPRPGTFAATYAAATGKGDISSLDYETRVALGLDGDSPRLLEVTEADMLSFAAPLLAPPQHASEGDEDRFCTKGPELSSCAEPKKSNTANAIAVMPFSVLVSRVENATSQASLLLNERLAILHRRCNGAVLSKVQEKEMCDLADDLAAAAYHTQKWAFLLQTELPPGTLQAEVRKPTKPSKCLAPAEAFACFHVTLPRIMVSSADAQKALTAIVKARGPEAEAVVNGRGVRTEDLRALAPHLERLVTHAGRLSSSIRPAPPLSRFVPEYFAPKLGKGLAVKLLPYLVEPADN